MSKRAHLLLERAVILCMVLGIIGMFQSFNLSLYTYGFTLLLFSTIAFIIVSHLSVKED